MMESLPRERCTRSGLVAALYLVALGSVVIVGCRDRSGTSEVTLYSSVDEPFARQVVAEFTRQTGIAVQLKLDTESGKTTGLVRRILAAVAENQEALLAVGIAAVDRA